jgi:hypothetical protein
MRTIEYSMLIRAAHSVHVNASVTIQYAAMRTWWGSTTGPTPAGTRVSQPLPWDTRVRARRTSDVRARPEAADEHELRAHGHDGPEVVPPQLVDPVAVEQARGGPEDRERREQRVDGAEHVHVRLHEAHGGGGGGQAGVVVRAWSGRLQLLEEHLQTVSSDRPCVRASREQSA